MPNHESSPTSPVPTETSGLVKEEDNPLIIAAMKEIGSIVRLHGKYSEYKSSSGRLDDHTKIVTLPMTQGQVLEASISTPTNERMRSEPRINIRVSGTAPAHYMADTTPKKSLTCFAKKPWDRDDTVAIYVNKFFYPEAKEFEKPKPAETETERLCEAYFPVTEYSNKDGIDHLNIMSPLGRLGDKTHAFAETFALEALDFLKNHYETKPVVETHMLPDQQTSALI